jgi:hypothetical protein
VSVAEPFKSAARQASSQFLQKVAAAVRRADEIRDERKAAEVQAHEAQSVAHQAQVSEAATRTELTLALSEALIGRAEAQGHLRAEAFRRYLAEARPRPLRRRTRASRSLDQLLSRLLSPGQGLVIARSGLWRGTGRPLFDLRHMAAYARRGAEPAVQPPALFDQAWYLATYADVRAAGTAPLVHYLLAGAGEDRDPHPLFDAAWYRRHNAADLAATGLSPLEHYVRLGAARGRSPHPLFDIAHYAAQTPERLDDEDPLSHYLREGWRRGLSPHPLFDPAWYRRSAPRAARETAPLLHYVTQGWRKGVQPHPLFDPAWYLAQNPDVAETGAEPLAHFATVGGQEGRSPSPWFDTAHYVAVRGEALAAQANPLVDYLQGGAWAVVEARPGFPTAAYLASTPELVRQGVTPLEHWARRQAR